MRAALREFSSFGGQPAGLIQAVICSPEARKIANLNGKVVPLMSGRPGFLRRHAWSLAGTLAAALLAPAFDWSALASPPDEVEEVQPVSSGGRASKPEIMVSLNHLSTPWEEVLHKLADGTQSTLVMHAVPEGRFSRHDWHKHTRTEAVRILNRDLEKLGYRILEKGKFLTVLEVQHSHVDYQRPVIGERRASLAANEDQSGSTDANSSGIEVADHEQVQDAPRRLGAASGSRTTSSSRNKRDRQVAHAQHVESEGQLESGTATAEASAPVANSSVTIAPTKRRATEIAKQIHRAFGTRSKLVDAGPNGFPAFVVSHPQPQDAKAAARQTQPHFTVEIDADRNELILTAGEERVAHLENLIRMLDKASWTNGQKQELVAGQAAAVAGKLQPQLSQLIADREQETGNKKNRRREALAQAGADEGDSGSGATEELFNKDSQSTSEADGPQPGAMSEDVPGNKPAQDRLPALLDTLKGDVSLESMPDLDLLILRGNEKDVEAVMKVIRTIEQMAEGSTPEIHLRRLEHVDSQSLAALLTQVYERMVSLRTGTAQKSEAQIAVIPVVTPNAVLILAPGNALESVLELTRELDQQVNPQHHVEVFPLEHAIASQVVTTIEGFYPNDATLRPGLSTRIRVSADTRTNSIIVQAQPRDMEEVKALIKRVDRDEAGSISRAKIIKLKSASAEELAQFLQQAVQSVISSPTTAAGTTGAAGGATGQNSQQLRETKSVVLEFLAHDESTKELVRSGLLSDVRINADARTNSLLVTAPKQSLVLIEELIRVLDMPSSAVAEIKVFPLKNADATDAVSLLETLFSENATNQQSGVGVQLAGTSDAGSNLVPLKFSTDGRTNSVVAIGGGDALRIVEAILLRLDDNDSLNRKTTVIRLKNNPATDVATALNQFLQSQRNLAQIDPTRVSMSQLLDQEVIITPEARTNSLIISATPRYFDSIMELASQLDREPQQVAIQALLVEVTLDNKDEFGVELGFQDSILFDRSVINQIMTVEQTNTSPNGVQTTSNQILSQSGTPGFPFNNLPLGNNLSGPNTGRVGSQGLSNFALGRTSGDLGYGGLVLSASSDSVNVLVRALSARRNVRILSRPSVTVLDNQIAEIQVGQVVPVTDGATIGINGNVVPTIMRDNAGIILTVTPRISNEGQVVMEVAAEKSRYTGEGVTVLTDSNGGEVTSPVKDITTANTTVKVPDGQTIVVGGMITNTDETSERKVPWLGDVPIVGQLFRYDSQSHYRTELLIFLTPRVIRCDQDSEEIKKVEAQRIHYFEDEAEMIHGPLFGVPMEPGSVPPPQWEANILPQAISPPPHETPLPPAPEPNGAESAPQPIQQMKYEKTEAPSGTKIKAKAKPSFFKKSARSAR